MYQKFQRIAFTRRVAQFIALLAFTTANTGCYYYKSVEHDRMATTPKKFCRILRSSLDPYKYVIVHQGNNMWHLGNMDIYLPDKKHCSPGFNVMYGSLEKVDSTCAYYYDRYKEKDRRALRYYVRDEDYVISQVHVYLEDSYVFRTDSLSIPVSAINRIEVLNQATGRTSWTWVAVNIGLEILFSEHSSYSSHSSHASPINTQNVHYGPRK